MFGHTFENCFVPFPENLKQNVFCTFVIGKDNSSANTKEKHGIFGKFTK